MGKHAGRRALDMRVGIDLDLLIPAERRDLEDALLAAASGASVDESGVLPLDLLSAPDAGVWATWR